MIHIPTGMSQQGGDPPVPVPAEPGGQPHNIVGQGLLVIPDLRLMALGGARLLQHPADSPLRYRELLHDMLDAVAATGGAQKFPSAASFSIWLSRVNSATARLNGVS